MAVARPEPGGRLAALGADPVALRRSGMRIVRIVAIAVVILVALALAFEAHARPADLRVAASGRDAGGEAMSLACDLHFVSVPSNVLAGTCRVSVGADHLALAGGDGDRQRAPTVVLNGLITIRGIPDSATGRFAPLVEHGVSGFPVHLVIDPLRRDWAIRSDVPGGGSETVASGHLTAGRIVFAIP